MTTLRLFGGKGGVGKTTVAAAAGLAAASQGRETLVVSTDPAHSLADAFDRALGPEPTVVRDSLRAVQTDPERGTERYRRLFERVTEELDAAGIDLEDAALEELFAAGGLPGGDELAALDAVGTFVADDRFDRVILDTAPTGHTLRLLDLPETVGTGVRTALSLKSQVRRKTDAAKTMVLGPWAALDTDAGDEDADFAELASDLDRIATVLRDPDRTRFHVVTLPEELAVRETERLLAELDAADIPVGALVVNRVLEEIDEDCRRCRTRRERQQSVVEDLAATLPDLSVRTLPDRLAEPRGLEGLDRLAADVAAAELDC